MPPVSGSEPDTHARQAILSGTPHPTAGARSGSTGPRSATATFQTGTPFGHRYHLIRQLGVGGMGAVYQAWDEELAVVVAIKVIRPEAMADPAAARELEKRFKRELLLARNVTHKNVVRIHDLGEIEGVKYITMPYVNGADLATILDREGRLPVARALSIARQVAAGLVAAHDAGVVHRDLKPANILLDEDEHALITDFGIARSLTGPGGGTIVGTVVGTLDYMAPEQARAEAVDHRADIYAFGLILSDMLIGRRKIAAGATALASLLDRISKPPTSIRAVDPSIPQALDEIVLRCVQTDPALRYQRTQELLIDLEAAAGESTAPSPASTRPHTRAGPTQAAPRAATITISLPNLIPQGRKGRWVATALLAVAVVAGGLAVYRVVSGRSGAPATSVATPTGESVSLAILPFRNASGDSSLDWLGSSVAQMLGTTIGQSAALKTVPSGRVSQILTDLRIAPDSTLDPSTLGRLAELSGADTVLWGQYIRFGNEIRIDATLQDVKRQRTIALKTQAANERDVPGAIERLSASVRENLALSPTAVKALAAASFAPSSKSVQALRYYNEGLELSREGRYLAAVKRFETATQEDPEFALAYSKLARSYATLGRGGDAERFSRTAVTSADTLPPNEKTLILAAHASILNDRPKAIEYYKTLQQSLPTNDDVQSALATLYKDTGAYDEARKGFAELLARDPHHVEALVGAGQVESWSGKPNDALEYLNKALTTTIRRGNDEGKATVLRALGGTYASLNKPQDALRHYEDALGIERRLGRTGGVAETLHAIAQMKDDAGDSDGALAHYREALALRREIGDKQGVGNVLNDLGGFFAVRGRYDDALAQFKDALQIQREVRNPVYEAAALNNIGYIYLSLGKYDEAQTYLQQAVTIRERINVPADVADTLHNLAEVSVRTGAYDTAQGQYLKALELWRQVGNKRAAAIELYELGDVFEYQGRYGAAVDSKAEAVKIFKEIGDRGSWLPKVLASYGSALSQTGKAADAQRVLDEALPLARELKNDALVAEILNYQGDARYYTGDFKGAQSLYPQAESLAAKSKLRPLQLRSRLNLSKVAVEEGRSTLTAPALTALGAEAGRLGLRFDALKFSLLAAATELRLKNHGAARARLESAITEAERLRARMLLAEAHHMLAEIDTAEGNRTEARRHAETAQQLVEAIRKDARGDEVLRRPDLKRILGEPAQ
jgi:eukaryotic-like serine/threonine-protein kinase